MNDTLAAGAEEVGQFSLTPEALDPAADVIDKSCAMSFLHSRWREKVNELDVRIAVGAMPARATVDGGRACQVISNLLTNAIKFTERGGVVSLEADCVGGFSGREGCFLRVVVRDDGPGLSPQGIARLFKPWHQADESVKAKYGGSGLGAQARLGMRPLGEIARDHLDLSFSLLRRRRAGHLQGHRRAHERRPHCRKRRLGTGEDGGGLFAQLRPVKHGRTCVSSPDPPP